MFEYRTRNTCSTKIRFRIENGKIRGLSFENGCNGNLKALSRLVEGMSAHDVVARLRGINCKERGTSCADQLALAIIEADGKGK